MKVTTGEIEATLRQRKRGSSQAPGPAKRARQEGPSRTAAAAAAAVGAARAPPPGNAPAEERPAEREVPAPAGTETEEGEIPAATEALVAVINLEEEAPAATATPGVGQVTVAVASSAVAPLAVVKPEVRGVPVVAGGKRPQAERDPPTARGERPVERGPTVGTPTAERKRDEPSGSSQRLERRATRRPVEGARAGPGRPGPRLQSLQDPVQAAVMLAHARTPESTEEVQGLNFGAILDGIMVAMVQAANYTFGLRDAVAETSQALTRALARGDRYRKESEDHQQGLTQFREASQARENQLNSRLREAESQTKAESGRASAAEAKLELALGKLMAAEAQVEELSSRLQRVSDEALEGARAAAERIAAAEKTAVEAGLEKAGAVAYADEASARASEAEAKVEEAEAKARRAEEETKTAAQKAVEEYKASSEFRQEVIEGSLEAYSQAFQACKEKISKALKIDMSKLEGICPEGDEEELENVERGPKSEEP